MTPGEPFSPRRMFVGVFIPDALLACRDLSLGAKLLWAVLARMAGDNGHCWPSQEALSKICGCSVREVRNRVKELVAYGLIRANRKGFAKSNRYEFLWHQVFEQEPAIFAAHRGTNVPLIEERPFLSFRNKCSSMGEPQVTENTEKNPKKQPRKREIEKRNMKREKQASCAPEARTQPAIGQLDIAVEALKKALQPHAQAIHQDVSEEIIIKLIEASQGKPLAAASLIGKLTHRRFSDHAPAGYRQPWPDSLNYWIRVVREELRDLA
jgi:hypothetical protein